MIFLFSMDFVKRVMMFHSFISILVFAYFIPRGPKACVIATIFLYSFRFPFWFSSFFCWEYIHLDFSKSFLSESDAPADQRPQGLFGAFFGGLLENYFVSIPA